MRDMAAAGNSLLDRATVNLFRGSVNPKPVNVLSLAQVLDAIQDGTYQQPVQRLRDLFQAKGKRAYDVAKKQLDAVTFCGTFSPTRAKANLTFHNGIVHGDLDHLMDLDAAKQSLGAAPHIVYCFTSPSGTGLKVGVRVTPVDDDAAYKHAWQAVADAHQRKYGLIWDPTGKDISRLCYVGWDPALYRNAEARLFPVPTSTPVSARPPAQPPVPFDVPRDRRERYAALALNTAIDMIDRSILGNRHQHRLKASELLGGYIAGGILTHDEAWGALAQAVARNTDDLDRSLKTVADGLQHGRQRPITLDELEAERQAWITAHRSTTRPGHVPRALEVGIDAEPPVSDPWDGTITFPVRPYTGYRGLRYGREVARG